MREYSPDPTATSERGRPLYYADFDKELSTALIMVYFNCCSSTRSRLTTLNFIIFTNQSSLTDHNMELGFHQNARNALFMDV